MAPGRGVRSAAPYLWRAALVFGSGDSLPAAAEAAAACTPSRSGAGAAEGPSFTRRAAGGSSCEGRRSVLSPTGWRAQGERRCPPQLDAIISDDDAALRTRQRGGHIAACRRTQPPPPIPMPATRTWLGHDGAMTIRGRRSIHVHVRPGWAAEFDPAPHCRPAAGPPRICEAMCFILCIIITCLHFDSITVSSAAPAAAPFSRMLFMMMTMIQCEQCPASPANAAAWQTWAWMEYNARARTRVSLALLWLQATEERLAEHDAC